MKNTTFCALAVVMAGGTNSVFAQQETARVVSTTPVLTQVAVPRQVCSQQQVQVQSQKSGAGGIMGAVAGGAIGSNIGGGDGRAIATLIGVIGGAMLGDKIEGPGQTQTQNVQTCTTQTFYETRTTAYNVVYEYGGKQYSVQMPQDPGPTLRLQITPIAAAPSQPVYQQPPYQQPTAVLQQPEPVPPVIQQAPQVTGGVEYIQPVPPPYVVTQQVNPVVIAAAIAAPILLYRGIGFGWGYNHRSHGHGHGRWR